MSVVSMLTHCDLRIGIMHIDLIESTLIAHNKLIVKLYTQMDVNVMH